MSNTFRYVSFVIWHHGVCLIAMVIFNKLGILGSSDGVISIAGMFLVVGILFSALGLLMALLSSELSPAWMAFSILVASSLFVMTFAAFFHGQDFLLEKQGGDFENSLYFSVVTWTTLGYGDIQPEGDMKLIAACEAVIGYLYLGMFVGVASGLVLQKNPPPERGR